MAGYDPQLVSLRLWDKATRADSGCLEWRRALNGTGYGTTSFERRQWIAPRLAYTVTFGPIPHGMCVCHRCDNRLCIEPSHLFLGTTQDNTRDRHQKGRDAKGPTHAWAVSRDRMSTGDRHYARTRPELLPRGERHGCAKLTENDVRAIRAEYAVGGTQQRALAGKYGISRTTVREIVNRHTWAHVE